MVREPAHVGHQVEIGQKMIVVEIRHIRAADLCARGARAWFEKYGLSWSDLLEGGLPVEVIEATGDALAYRVAAIAREEAAHGRR